MYTNPNEVLVKRSDLLPVENYGDYYLIDGLRYDKDPEHAAIHHRTAIRLLTVATRIADDEAEVVARKEKEWELEYAVPLARQMHDTFHSFSSNYREITDEDLWLRNYKNDNHLVKKWVSTASAVLKAQETEGAE